jgi:hypothetical protein
MKNAIAPIMCLLLAIPCTAKILYVDDDAPGPNNGSSWTEAYNFLQDALADANSSAKPVEIRVAQGIYKPDQGIAIMLGDRTSAFQLINGVTIKGGYAGFGEPDPNARDIEIYVTVLSGDLDGNDVDVNDPCDLPNEPSRAENSYHVASANGTDATAELDGFTITAGNASYFSVWPGDGDPRGSGGGVYIEGGSPRIVNCTITRNSAFACGGGMYNEDSSPTLTNCTFDKNSAYPSDPTLRSHGGGTFNDHSTPMLIDCTFSENLANWGGGMFNFNGSDCTVVNCVFSSNSADWDDGGGMCNYVSSPTLVNCTFSANMASDGGGMANWFSSPTVTGCTFNGNWAYFGGGMCDFEANTTLSNCVLDRNQADIGGGGINSSHTLGLTMDHCTFAGNWAEEGAALSCDFWQRQYPSYILLTNCILWDAGGEIWNNDGSTITVIHSDVKGGPAEVYDPCEGLDWGQGNIDTYPWFADPMNGDYHLKSQAGRYDPNTGTWTIDELTSPCIDAGDPMSPIGAEPFPNGGIVNMGAYGGTAEASKSYFGEPLCETIVAGDINGDCKVDFKDFRLMAFHWLKPLPQRPQEPR